MGQWRYVYRRRDDTHTHARTHAYTHTHTQQTSCSLVLLAAVCWDSSTEAPLPNVTNPVKAKTASTAVKIVGALILAERTFVDQLWTVKENTPGRSRCHVKQGLLSSLTRTPSLANKVGTLDLLYTCTHQYGYFFTTNIPPRHPYNHRHSLLPSKLGYLLLSP